MWCDVRHLGAQLICWCDQSVKCINLWRKGQDSVSDRLRMNIKRGKEKSLAGDEGGEKTGRNDETMRATRV